MSATLPSEFTRYLRTETFGGVVLVMAAAAALIWVNSPAAESYTALRDAELGPDLLHLRLTVGTWAQDGLLAVFFFVAGLELKRELVIGELSTRDKAVLPVLAAVGGVITPALICLAVGWGSPGFEKAWSIPMATDIAFALGVLALVGSRIPSSARVFLLALAVVDDLIAIAVIAVVFSHGIQVAPLAVATVGCAAYTYAQHRRITTALFYLPVAIVVWIAVLNSGVHATVAGVALGLLTRVRTDPGEAVAPAGRLAHRIQPVSAAICVPVFALFAAGVSVNADALSRLGGDRIALGIALGLLVGKPIGIFGTSLCAIRFGIAAKPSGLRHRDLLAVCILGGIGFTVSLLLADLSLDQADAATAKAAVLLSSLGASLLGAAALIRRGRRMP
ncbi:Na+/H+ antiporter NhaA [Williamsia sterculiae]|uniref:Na+/H+ antiporter NhaA n=1 Tax=Williamsia sterculiae TaxID=1344003 RepID=UPI00190EDC01